MDSSIMEAVLYVACLGFGLISGLEFDWHEFHLWHRKGNRRR